MVDLNTAALKLGAQLLEREYRDEINRVIDNVKRTALDKWFRRYKAQRRKARRALSQCEQCPWVRK